MHRTVKLAMISLAFLTMLNLGALLVWVAWSLYQAVWPRQATNHGGVARGLYGHPVPFVYRAGDTYRVGPHQTWPSLSAVKDMLATNTRVQRGSPPAHIVLEENIEEIDVRLRGISNVTIEARQGKTITWSAPEGTRERALLVIHECSNVHVNGIIFDGKDRVDYLMCLARDCPGTALDNISLKGYRKFAIQFFNCAGTVELPVVLQRVSFLVPELNGVDYSVNKHLATGQPANRHIKFVDCVVP